LLIDRRPIEADDFELVAINDDFHLVIRLIATEKKMQVFENSYVSREQVSFFERKVAYGLPLLTS
jgi:hypothetical protein